MGAEGGSEEGLQGPAPGPVAFRMTRADLRQDLTRICLEALSPTPMPNQPQIDHPSPAPVSHKSCWEQLSQASRPGPGPQRRCWQRVKEAWTQGRGAGVKKREEKRDARFEKPQWPWWGELASPLNKDMFFSAWDWCPGKLTHLGLLAFCMHLNPVRGTEENKAPLLPSRSPPNTLCQTEV